MDSSKKKNKKNKKKTDKHINKQTKYGGFIDKCDCYHYEKRNECCKLKNGRT